MQEAVHVVLVAEEVAADFLLVLLEERADHLREVAEQHTVDLFLGIKDAEKIVEVLLVIRVFVNDQHLGLA